MTSLRIDVEPEVRQGTVLEQEDLDVGRFPLSAEIFKSNDKLSELRQDYGLMVARMGEILLFVWFVMTALGLLPTNTPQEDLPDKNPVPSSISKCNTQKS